MLNPSQVSGLESLVSGLEGPPPGARSLNLPRKLFLGFVIMSLLELHFDQGLGRVGSDFGCPKPCQNGSRLRFGLLKASF